MRSFVEYLWGWDATASETVTDGMWKETFDVYVEDKHKMGMAEFFDKSSPFAYQDITARMLETVRKGYWKADAATEKKLLEEYVAERQSARRGLRRTHLRQPAAAAVRDGTRDSAPAFPSRISKVSSARWRRRRARRSIRPPNAKRHSAARTTRRWPPASKPSRRRAARRGSSKGI